MGLPPFKKPPESRTRNMRAIRSFRNKTTESRLVSLLTGQRLQGWRRRSRDLPGAPDFVFRYARTVLFADGCFWHGCPKCGHIPKTNKAYWQAKISRNRARDARITRKLRRLGFSVVRLRECDLKKHPSTCLRRIERALKRRRADR